MKVIVAAIVLMFLTACETTKAPPPQIVPVTKFVKYDCGMPPSIDTFSPLTFTWRVLPGPSGGVLFTLTPQDYENLGKNLADILSSKRQLQAQRNFFMDCIRRANEAAAK